MIIEQLRSKVTCTPQNILFKYWYDNIIKNVKYENP